MKQSLLTLAMIFFVSFEILSQVSTKSEPKVVVGKELDYLPYKAQRTKEQNEKLRPRAEDIFKFAEFLKEPKTGIFRLMNDLGCDSNSYVFLADEKCGNAIPGSSFYSFRTKEYSTSYRADIRLKDNFLISDGLLSQNILVSLGDISLEDVTLKSNGMKFLVSFVPEEWNYSANKQSFEITRGVRKDLFEYRKVLPALENQTYGLRIIAYRGSFYRSFRGRIYDLLAGDKRIDLVVVFRIIRKDSDSSVTLLWKELTRKKSPKLKYKKG